MYLFLIIILLILFYFFYKRCNKDILSPTSISILMFAFCTFMAMMGRISWNNEKLNLMTIFVIIIGLSSFAFGEILARKNNKENKINNQSKSNKIIKIENYKYLLTIIGIVISIILIIFEIKRICNYYSFESNNLGELLSFYRTKIGLFSTDLAKDKMEMNFFVKQLKKVCDVVCVIYMYIFVNNIYAKDSKKNIIKYAIPILLTLFVTLLSSGRSIMMHMIVAICMMFFLMYSKQNQNKNVSKKIICFSGISLVIALSVFCMVLPIVGRKTNNNIYNYLTFYIGTSIPSFDRFIEKPPVHSKYIGNETFSGVYYVLNKVGLMNYEKKSSLEWNYYGKNASNVYTSLRRYYFDFGIIGVIICQFVFGYLISKLYLKVKPLTNRYLIVFYSFFSYILIDQIRDEQFFCLISSSTVAYIILISFLVWFLFEFNIKKIKWEELSEKNNKKLKKN